MRYLESNEDHLQTTILKFQLMTAAIFTKKGDFGNYQEMDSEHLQTSNSGLFVLMLLSLHKELHLRCSLGFRIHPCYFFLRFSEILKVFSRTRWDLPILRLSDNSDNSSRIGETFIA